jgi:hypothetical protein
MNGSYVDAHRHVYAENSVELAVQDLVFARAIVAGSRSAINNTLK